MFNISHMNRILKLHERQFKTVKNTCKRRCFSNILDEKEKLRLDSYNIPRIKKNEQDDLSDFNLSTHVLQPWVDKQPGRTALWFCDDARTTKKVSYGEVLEHSLNLASALSNGKFCAPKCAIVILPKILPWWIINFGGSLCETAISPGTPMLSAKDILYRIKLAKADAIFVDSAIMDKIFDCTHDIKWKVLTEETKEKELENLREGWFSYHQLLEEGSRSKFLKENTYNGESIAQLFFTSGTTGYPKMVPHSQRNYCLGHIPTARDWLSLSNEDILWNISDLGWAKAAFSSLYAPFIAGATAFVHKSKKFDAKTVLEILETNPISVVCLPPTALRAILQEDLSSFRPMNLQRVMSAGESLNPEIVNMWYQHTGIKIREGYGQTECTLVCSSFNGVDIKPGSMGKQTGTYRIKILDEDLTELKPNKIGQLALDLQENWPEGLFEGYPDKDQNKRAFQAGYFLTGDRAFKDSDEYLYYVGRSDDIIISAGYRIGPFEVESALLEHPAVVESAVVSSPDLNRGHVVKAFIILKTEYQKLINNNENKKNQLIEEIQSFVKENIAPYKYPRKIEFVDTLPKTVSGKIRRIQLREQEEKLTF